MYQIIMQVETCYLNQRKLGRGEYFTEQFLMICGVKWKIGHFFFWGTKMIFKRGERNIIFQIKFTPMKLGKKCDPE